MKTKEKLSQLLYHNSIFGEFFRYLIVGGLAFVADYGVLLLLNKAFHVHYLIAATLAFLVGIVVNYLGSIHFVFYHRGVQNVHMERGLFLLIGFLGLLLNDGLLYLFTGNMDIPVEYSKLITQAIVLLWNFVARKGLLFTRRNTYGK